MSLQKRIKELVSSISTGMHEREEIIAVSLLGALCGQNTFLYGPPGTAKSLISRRIACAFDNPAYFEYLMNRFSTPEEVFGPVSIKALKEDHYVRKTDNYLPKAEFAFLDEIWKSSPAILNTLLTLINEHIFRNGESIEKAPLKALIAASNETPDPNQGLDALYDRFIVRLMVGPIQQSVHFDKLLNSKPTEAKTPIPENLIVKPEEWRQWREKIHTVQLSKETMTIIHLIREELEKNHEELKVYVSDRRWQRAAMLMKAAAFFNDRTETNHSDAVLLQHCLWTHEDNRQDVMDIVSSAIKEIGFDSGVSLADIDKNKEKLDKEIYKELFHTTDVYETKKIEGIDFFNAHVEFTSHHYRNQTKELFIESSKINSKDKFHPTDSNGNIFDDITCEFDGQGTCRVNLDSQYYQPYTYKPTVLFHKGDKKQDINKRLVSSLTISVIEIREDLLKILNGIQNQFSNYEEKLISPFTPKEKMQLALEGISKQIESIELRIKDCERLEALCR
jgi:MoxR-like ATPase